MAYIEKIVKQERTGANIAGINAEGNTSSMINPRSVAGAPVRSTGTMQTYQYEIFDAIEKYAKEADKAKIENEKIRLRLGLEQSRLDLEEKWAEIPDKLSNKERYDEYIQDKKNLLDEQEKNIMGMKYMTTFEKQATIEENKIKYRKDFVETSQKRNEIYIAQQLDENEILRKQAVSLAKTAGMHDDGKVKEYYKDIVELVKTTKTLAGLSDNQAIELLTKHFSEAEMGRFQNRLEEIKMSEKPYQSKQAELNDLKSAMENKELIGAFADEIVEMFPVEDKEKAKEYFISSIKDTPTKLVNGYKAEINRLAAEERQAIAARNREEKERQKINERMDILENGEEYNEKNKAFKKVYGRPLEIEDFNSGRVDYDWEKAGKLNNGYNVKIFPNKVMKELKEVVQNEIENGASLSSGKNLVKKQAEAYFPNDVNKRNAFIKQYADSIGESAIAYVNGDVNPALYKADSLKKAGVEKNIPNIELSSFTFESGKEIKDFNEVSKKISAEDPRRGHELTKRLIVTAGMDMGISKEDILKSTYVRGKILKELSKKEKLIEAYREVTTQEKPIYIQKKQTEEKPKTKTTTFDFVD